MNRFRFFYFYAIFCGLSAFSFCGCATKKDDGHTRDDLSDLNIDPNQQALPADSGSTGVATATTPENPVEKEPEKKEEIPPTPTIDELSPDTQGAGIESNVPESPVYTDDNQARDAGDVVGSGPQTRFIKAAELNIRSEPNRYSKVIGKLRGGQRVKVKIKGDWARLDKGRWIRSRWLSKKQPSGSLGMEETDREHKRQAGASKKKSGSRKKTQQKKK